MKVIGITGGVGCGKSAVMDYLAEYCRCPVLKADSVGHLLMEPDMPCYKAMVDHFGQDILKEDLTIDRAKVAAIVFSDEKELAFQNELMHPAIRTYILQRIDAAEEENEAYCFVEAALFFEDHYDDFCDEVWYIYADASVRAGRLKASRGYSDEKIGELMANQLPEAVFRERCQFTLDNSGDFEKTKESIRSLLKEQRTEKEG